jgi:hypothetical protein
MRHQLPGTRRRKPAGGLLKPQHRMVLGLISMSAAALMLSLMYQKDEAGPAKVPKGASTSDRPRASVPLPAGGSTAAPEANHDTLSAAVHGVGPMVMQCLAASGPDLEPWSGLTTTVEVQLDGGGLARADVLDMKGAPAPFLGCLGAALASVTWPSGGDDILLVRVPITIESAPKVVPLGG